MPGAGAGFFAGLAKAFGSTLLENKRKKHDEELAQHKELSDLYLKGVFNGDIRPEVGFAKFAEIVAPMLGGDEKGKGKGKGKETSPIAALSDPEALTGLMVGLHKQLMTPAGIGQAPTMKEPSTLSDLVYSPEEKAARSAKEKEAESAASERGRLSALEEAQRREFPQLMKEWETLPADVKKGFSGPREFLESRGFFKALPASRTGAAPKPGTEGFHLQQWAKAQGVNVEDLTPEQIDKARKEFRSAGWASTATEDAKVNRAKTIAEAIRDGDQPPDLARMYGLSPYVREALAKEGLNLTDMQLDWTATQRYVQTLNTAQQVNLRQRMDALPGLLGSIRELATTWDAGRWKVLNKANLALAKQGAYGNEAAAVAQQLEAQIAETVTDLAVVYRGGNAATNDALKLAGTTLQGDWSKPVLLAALDRAEKNVKIRRSSLAEGPAGVSGQNRYFGADRQTVPDSSGDSNPAPSKKFYQDSDGTFHIGSPPGQ